MKPYVTRYENEEAVEKFSEAWGTYSGGFTVTQVQDGQVSEIHDYHPAFSGLQQSFFLQHYGLPSNILDITRSLDVGLFFAQNHYDPGTNSYSPASRGHHHPVIYLFLLMPEFDRFIDSEELSETYHLERPLRQHCGLICGASYITRNFYSRFISIKIHIKNQIPYADELTPKYLFPNRDEDPFLDGLLRFKEASGINNLAPFFLSTK